jgi:hypothetical protein
MSGRHGVQYVAQHTVPHVTSAHALTLKQIGTLEDAPADADEEEMED